MKTIKIKKLDLNNTWIDAMNKINEIIDALSEHPELLQEEKLPFVERMIGKEYWYIDDWGDKSEDKNENHPIDIARISINNAFFTESDCDKEITKRKALGNIMSYIRDNEIELVKDEDWKNERLNKYMIEGWDYCDKEVWIDESYVVDDSQFSLAFYSQEDREKVISNNTKDLETLLKK